MVKWRSFKEALHMCYCKYGYIMADVSIVNFMYVSSYPLLM